jgi:hypothetical protein
MEQDSSEVSEERKQELKEQIKERKVNTATHTTDQLKVKNVLMIVVPVLSLVLVGVIVLLFRYIGIGSAVFSSVFGFSGLLLLIYLYINDYTPADV